VDCGATCGAAHITTGVTDAPAVGPQGGERLCDGFLSANAVDDDIPFFGGESGCDAESDAARTASDEGYFRHERRGD
jgi:hypothetical protein